MSFAKVSESVEISTLQDRSTALKHFNDFLQKRGLTSMEKLTEPQACDFSLFDTFAGYLRDEVLTGKDQEPLVGLTAKQYLSSVKMTVKQKFPENQIWNQIDVAKRFATMNMKLVDMLNRKRMAQGLPVSNTARPMYRSGLRDCAHVLLLENTVKSVCNRSIIVTNFKACGRTGEVAGTEWESIEILSDFDAVHIDWDMQKTAKDKGLVICCDVDWRIDVFNCLASRWIVFNSADDSVVFSELNVASHASKVNTIFRDLDKLSLKPEYSDYDVCGYVGKSGRIGGPNTISVCPQISSISVFQAGGWDIGKESSFSSYERVLLGTKLKNATVLQGWPDALRNPKFPKLVFLTSENTSQFHEFVLDLFGMHGALVFSVRKNFNLALLCIARLIMDLSDMVCVLSWENIVLSRLKETASSFGWSQKMLLTWSVMVKNQWIQDNALHFELGENASTDPNLFIPLKDVASELLNIRREYSVMSFQMTQLSQIVNSIGSFGVKIDELMTSLSQHSALQTANQAPAVVQAQEPETPEQPDNSQHKSQVLSPWSLLPLNGTPPPILQLNSMRSWPTDLYSLKDVTLSQVFSRWFIDDLHIRDREKVGKDKGKSIFNDIRVAVYAMYHLATKEEINAVGLRPDTKTGSYSQWKDRLNALSVTLEVKLCEFFDKNSDIQNSSQKASKERRSQKSSDEPEPKRRRTSDSDPAVPKTKPHVGSNARRILAAQKLDILPEFDYKIQLKLVKN